MAVALREWLPGVTNNLVPFVSSKDIYAGTRWQAEIAGELERSNFGLVCVTRANQGNPWLNFEAGALAKAVESSRVVPLAIDLKVSDIELPLGQFQAQPASQHGIAEVLTSINGACDTSLSDGLLRKSYEKWWPDLENALSTIESRFEAAAPADGEETAEPDRSDRALLEETLNTVRALRAMRRVAGSAPTLAHLSTSRTRSSGRSNISCMNTIRLPL